MGRLQPAPLHVTRATEPPTELQVVQALNEARRRTLALIGDVSEEDLERVHSELMSPLVWDLGHIAAFEELWIGHRYGGRPLLHAELMDVYDAFETPRAERGSLPFLDREHALEYLTEVHEQSLDVISDRGVGDGMTAELIIRHEQQHNETMLQTLQLAHLRGYVATAGPASIGSSAETGLELLAVPGGRCTIGAGERGFAYDNERPQHHADVPAFLIGRTPVTNASYLSFVEAGGYRRREWWSPEGWWFREANELERPGGWTGDNTMEWRLGELVPLAPGRPVAHISWFEADAFARSHGLRLPTEIEWEKAATWDPVLGLARRQPWGEEPARPGVHANVDQIEGGPAGAAACPAGASPYGCLGMIGDVWEWTASDFEAYPGFAAFPYREYSEVFFGTEYKVLRGCSWATRTRVSSPTFRNWDFPQRRQIFAGVRVAADL